ncbi:MAG: NADH-quinone oxidoreductase subunit NuoG [Gammaproteobacteria bacterium]|nr:NADH-quinone oxidoreductase subunit NuoG [Gammaproteobacteria bacterium]
MSEDLVEIQVDGQALKAPRGALLIDITDANGIDIPRFCYHKKLSVAANCRMCLVEVEKAPKPLPACATQVMEGMVVHTRSAKAIAAQKGTMEFLLINHPLDCPICDQGGECELQDVAIGYGSDVSQFSEEKRVVVDEDIGSLIATEMTRCIHCTRCVRFGEEIAGMREMGATGRSEHVRIGTFIEKSISSEMSGNIIDLCPVGALTAKPSRYSARAWELMQHASVAPHDSVGSNLFLHTWQGGVTRVVPRDNESINEVWISDRDRFSYQALQADDRLSTPMIKQNGQWQEASWEAALAVASDLLKTPSADQIGALLSPNASLEELYLGQKLMRGLGSNHIDHRLRQLDFSDQEQAPVMPWLGQSIEALESLQAALLIGSNVRKEQPLIAHRLRKASLNGAQISFVNPKVYEFHFELAENIGVDPFEMVSELAAIAAAAGVQSGASDLGGWIAAAKPTDAHQAIANSLKADNSCVMLGNLAVLNPHYAALRALSSAIAVATDSLFSYLPEAANSAGAWLAGVLPHRGPAGMSKEHGLNAQQMLQEPRQAYLLLGVEAERDCADPALATAALQNAKVVAMTSFASESMKALADVLLPAATFAETSGTYVNATGLWQSCKGASKAVGEARPAWKVLRVLGNLLDLDGFEFISSEEVRDELKVACRDLNLDNALSVSACLNLAERPAGLLRSGDVPIYHGDALVRRATALQATVDADVEAVVINTAEAKRLALDSAETVKVTQVTGSVELPLRLDDSIPIGSAWLPTGIVAAESLGSLYATVELEKV